MIAQACRDDEFADQQPPVDLFAQAVADPLARVFESPHPVSRRTLVEQGMGHQLHD
jgi:hypothetical protein